MSAYILIVEDEAAIHQLLAYNLESEGFRTKVVETGEDVHPALTEEMPDLVLLDWMLPGLSGIEVCRMIRSKPETQKLPVIMLTARGEETERVRGLATGADDYVIKPFSVPEVMARIRSILRRVKPEAVSETLLSGDITLDRIKKRVSRGQRDIALSPTEFRLLEYLMQSPGRVYSRAQLLDRVWGNDNFVDERTVDVHVGRLRKNLSRGRELDPIRTVRGSGYAFDERFGR
ncbi:phosphate regulon transcriptional regulator PhoB [Aestuariivirga litoralis]|uniref:phosphate regulon transcriptional regulator PhoB n=1 Tax=Aestuariivirga litoralis TaxID=2650924 RepID=UPI0018C4D75E|nr:phosphate regulon transcriptional regulator PhoB [Aestuariivirga litoralis]MBG1233741.1 phosphate regulon transcriptional regulatory protein PhoB [Aestuariivirga litoralis]